MNTIELPKEVKFIMENISKAGYEAYIVGGCVRDAILGIVPKDWDITTSARPEKIKEIFENTVDTGLKNGTVTVVINKNNFEVTTYRIDGEYSDFRHPKEVLFTGELKEDLCRRDFTMNAIAYKDEYMDFFDGIGDIERKTIKAVGDPEKRFNEDALRMMRAVRFSAQLDFEIEENTFSAIQKNCSLIANVSAERIREELFKTLLSNKPQNLILLKKCGLASFVFPEISEITEEKLLTVLSAAGKCEKNISLRLGVVFFGLNIESSNILKRLKADNKTIKEVSLICELCKKDSYCDEKNVRHNISEFGEDIFIYALKALYSLAEEERRFDLCEIYECIENIIKDTIEKGYCTQIKSLAINGNILKEAGIKDGKRIGELLKFSLDHVLDYPNDNQKDVLIELCLKKEESEK